MRKVKEHRWLVTIIKLRKNHRIDDSASNEKSMLKKFCSISEENTKKKKRLKNQKRNNANADRVEW